MTRILLAPSHYLYDKAKFGSEYAHAFFTADTIAKVWPESVVVTGKKTFSEKTAYKVIEVQSHIEVKEMTPLRAVVFTFRYSFVAAWLMLTKKFDIYHHVRPFRLSTTFNLPVLLNLHRNIPFVIGSFCMPYEEDSHTGSLSILGKILKILSDKTLKKANLIYVYDEATKNEVEKISKSRVEIIPPGINGDVFRPLANKGYEKISIISVGYFIKRKRFDLLIESINDLVKQDRNIQLNLVGDGPEMSSLKQLVKDLNLQDHVNFLGFLPNSGLPDVYRANHIFACFQESESFGQVYLEALASGLPVVTSINNGSKSILTDEVGLMVEADDLVGFTESLNKIISDKITLKKMSNSARKYFQENYDHKIIALKYVESYRRLISESKN